ncbi:MAG: hypothetical protein JW885_02840 [Deltaproteobacteria bacterium]|nr:hypothetical protein [Candidatus Zymogenaceae bacterium]
MNPDNIANSIKAFLEGREYLSDYTVYRGVPEDEALSVTRCLWVEDVRVNADGVKTHVFGNPTESFDVVVTGVIEQSDYQVWDYAPRGALADNLLRDMGPGIKLPYISGDVTTGREMDVTAMIVTFPRREEVRIEMTIE